MYLTILILPIIGSIISGLLGRKIGREGSEIITCSCMGIALILSIIAYYEIGYNNSWVSYKIAPYIISDTININWGFYLDSLSVTMLVMVLTISTCVHLYSIIYMLNDPHIQRFMSYLSLFTFFMLILITGDNLIVIFIGWEGSYKLCPILYYINKLYIYFPNKRYFHFKKIKSIGRIGPHEEKTIMILIASLLGDGHLSKGSRFQLEQCSNNVEYLMSFHKYFSIKGYCSTKKPKLSKKIHKNGKIHYSYQFKTYTFSSFNWIHDMFYDKNNKKILPKNIEQYLTPLVLAIWFMNDGSSKNNGLKISAQSFTLQELEFLCIILYKIFGIFCKPQFRGIKYNNYVIYIYEESCYSFSYIIKPYMLQSMYYKLGKYIP